MIAAAPAAIHCRFRRPARGCAGSGPSGMPASDALFGKHKGRPVAATRNVDAHPLFRARFTVILGQTGTQTSHFHANHGIDLWIVIRRAVENLSGDYRFLERLRMVFESLFHQIAKQAAAAICPGERRIGEGCGPVVP